MKIKEIKELLKKKNMKIGKKAMKKLNLLAKEHAEKIIENAIDNAKFSGRKIIKEEDIKEAFEF